MNAIFSSKVLKHIETQNFFAPSDICSEAPEETRIWLTPWGSLGRAATCALNRDCVLVWRWSTRNELLLISPTPTAKASTNNMLYIHIIHRGSNYVKNNNLVVAVYCPWVTHEFMCQFACLRSFQHQNTPCPRRFVWKKTHVWMLHLIIDRRLHGISSSHICRSQNNQTRDCAQTKYDKQLKKKRRAHSHKMPEISLKSSTLSASSFVKVCLNDPLLRRNSKATWIHCANHLATIPKASLAASKSFYTSTVVSTQKFSSSRVPNSEKQSQFNETWGAFSVLKISRQPKSCVIDTGRNRAKPSLTHRVIGW